MKTRRRFSAEFKAKVALEAIRGERTTCGVGHEASVSPEPDHAMETAGHRELGQDV